jgi:membrane peptidoglycan carboxypeptidase
MRVTKRRALGALGLITALPLVVFYPYYGHAPCRVGTRVVALKSGTELLDATGKRLGFLDPTRDRYVPLDSMPRHVRIAFTAVEDRRLHSAVGNLKPGNDSRRGASTIPMQLARALCGDRMPRDHSWSGKLAEAGLGTYLTARFGKRQLVELYLNSVYLGRNRKGVDAAARSYYGKSATTLSAADAAELAHLVANPRDRDPSQNDVPTRRAAISSVFAKMHRFDTSFAITKKRLALSRTRMAAASPMMYRGYVSRVRDGFSTCEPSVTCPTSVRTFLDAGLQRSAERELTALVQRLQGRTRPRRANDSTPQREVAGIFVAMRVSTGEIVSYTGRHGRTAAGADLLRIGRIQPASTIKPLLLAAALDDGNMYVDETLGELMGSHCTDPKVHEYLATLSGYEAPDRTIAEAMLRSDNLLGACLMAGLSLPARHRLVNAGILRNVNAVPADGLGLQTVAPLDLLTAYASLRTRERALLPRFSSYDASGMASPLMSAMSADETYSLLQGVTRQGTAWRAASVLSDDYALAGKTGTAGKGRELVFVGFARDLVALLWVGVVSGPGAVSPKHASDVVVEPWARILRAYAPRQDDGEEFYDRGFERRVMRSLDRRIDNAPNVQITGEELQRWIGKVARVVQRQTL